MVGLLKLLILLPLTIQNAQSRNLIKYIYVYDRKIDIQKFPSFVVFFNHSHLFQYEILKYFTALR